jgi:mutator protein MutT
MAMAAAGRAPEIEVAAGLVFRQGRLLITRRREGDHLGGLWEFPGGKRESHETFEECLRRELKEELDAEVQVGSLIQSVRHAYPERAVHLKFFRCVLTGGEPKALGCDALAWVGPDELLRYSFPPADARLLDLLRESPGLWREPG